MSNLSRLLEVYKEDKRTLRILHHLYSDSPARILLEKMVGAQEAFALAGTFLADPTFSHIFICAEKEEAAYLQNTLDNLIENQSVLFFPDSFRRPRNYEEINRNNILQRTESIHQLTLDRSKGSILITYPEAIFEKVVDPKIINEHRISIAKEDKVDLDTLFEFLIEYGFERVEYVYEPGQFSVRGGIIDIFSFGNEWPYRVELFDDEVESLRMFNPTTQLSVRTLSKVSIIPHINRKFRSDEKVSIFEVLSQKTAVWISDFEMVLDRLQICFEKVGEYAQTINQLEDEDLKQVFSDRSFLYPNHLIDQLGSNPVILCKKPGIEFKFDEVLQYHARPQPSFNKNFNLLIADLEEKQKNGIECFLFTDNTRQIERFYSIFEDLDAQVKFHPVLKSVHSGFIDLDLKLACYTDHQIFERFHRYRLRKGFTKEQAISLRILRELQSGDYVVHIDHGVGRYSGLEKINISEQIQESVRLVYKNNDLLYVSIHSLHKISKYTGKEGTAPKLDKIGSDAWKTLKRKTKNKVKDIAKELIHLYAKRKSSEGFAFEKDSYLQNELEASFIYEDTPDQYNATRDIKEDMQKPFPMDRLICGDVGFGKTEVAIRAAFKAVISGKQAAILVPTTILALQHYKTFNERLGEFGVDIDYINRFKSTAEKKAIYEKLKNGQIDVIIGTQALLNKRAGFKDLGLLIIDEEQKFGVAAKEKLRNLKVNVDTLTLTATPIPRTLQFSLMAARDLSIIRTPPPNRQPIHTERQVFSDNLIKESIYYEVNRGGQVFFVHNRIKNLNEMAAVLSRLCPDVKIAVAHGQMEAKKLEKTLVDFIDQKYDVLVCTNIIETGLDIPNANTMIINNAHQFGMSDLHQLRGRVGRSNKKAYCYLFAPPLSVLTPEARKRIKALEEFTSLGSGFDIAMRDLDIRGAGNLLGAEQSGFIADIGYETYQKILEEAVTELKETEFKQLFKEELQKEKNFVKDVQIETDIEMLIPDNYVSNIQERLRLYTELDSLKNEQELEEYGKRLEDRFGKLPKEVLDLFHGLRLRWLCKELGFERLSLKKQKMRCYFIANMQSIYYESAVFNRLMETLSLKGDELNLSLKQSKNYLIMIKDGVKNVMAAHSVLTALSQISHPQTVE